MTRERGNNPGLEEAAEKKPRGVRKKVTTEVLVPGKSSEEEQVFVASSEVPRTVEEIVESAKKILPAEVVVNITDQYERAITRGMKSIEEMRTADLEYDASKARGALYSAKLEMLDHLIKSAIQNVMSKETEDRLIPELFNRSRARTEYIKLVGELEEGEEIIFVSMDLDGFKRVNDILGHEAGDRVLRSFGTSLIRATRPGDVVVHFSGDEFGLILKVPKQENINIQKILERVIGNTQAEVVKIGQKNGGTQEVSTGYTRIEFGDKDQIDFENARDRSDQASSLSKLVDILSYMRQDTVGSTGRIVAHEKISEILSQYSDEEIETAKIIRGIHREMQGKLTMQEMVKLAKLLQNGEMKKILATIAG